MHAVRAVVISSLILGLAHGPVFARTEDDWLSSLRMTNVLTGWAVDAQGWSGVVAKGAVESVVRTIDGGMQWKNITPPDPPGQQIQRVYKVDVLDSLTAWVSATPTTFDATILFRTIDGGETWKNVTLPEGADSIDFINAHEGWFMSWEGAVYHSTDGGETWNTIASRKLGHEGSNFPFHQMHSLTFLDATTGVVTGFTDASDSVYLYVTHDGGQTWQQQKLPASPQVTGPKSIGGPPTFFTSRDGILPELYGTYNSETGVVFYVTHDGGATWKYTTPVSLTNWYRSSSFADENHGWVTDGYALCATSDGGRRWTTIQTGLPFDHIQDVDFISPQVGLAAGQALFPPLLLKTVDGGHTWKSLPYVISR